MASGAALKTSGAAGAVGHAASPSSRRFRVDLSATPGRLRLLLLTLVLLSLAWGAFAAFAVNQYSSAASSVVAVREPLSLDAQQIYRHPIYAGEIETARADNRQGFPLGAAYLREASGLMRSTGTEVRVGRRSVSRGIDPEIDLTGPPADPGVSRLHALLVAGPDGTWSVVDPGSENGTLLNGNTIPANQAVALHDGDRIHLGAWTALTITRDPEVIGGPVTTPAA